MAIYPELVGRIPQKQLESLEAPPSPPSVLRGGRQRPRKQEAKEDGQRRDRNNDEVVRGLQRKWQVARLLGLEVIQGMVRADIRSDRADRRWG